jgi:hypothetical protein
MVAKILLHGQQELETLLRVSKETYTSELGYVVWIVKCYISTNSPEEAWILFTDQGLLYCQRGPASQWQ